MNERRKKGCLALVAALGLTAVVVYFAGHLIDPHVALRTERRIDAPPEEVFRYVGTPEGVVEWWEHVGGPDMEGMAVVADGDTVEFRVGGSVAESWRLEAAHPPRVARWTIDFQVFEVTRRLRVEPDGTGSLVTWSEEGWIHNPAARYMTIVMSEEDTTSNFDMALDALAELVEGGG